jgi:hypothetical protein
MKEKPYVSTTTIRDNNSDTREYPARPGSPKTSLREVRLESEAITELYEEFLEDLRTKIEDPSVDNNILCRDFLAEIYLGKKINDDGIMSDNNTSLPTKVLSASFDPRHITLEPEYYTEVDLQKYYQRKPLIF